MKSKLIKGAMFVTIASFLVKILSIVYKIPYQNLTGDKGFYIYQQMYPLYALIVAMSSFAIPLSISEQITENKSTKLIISSSFYFTVLLSLLLSLFIILFNPFLGNLMGDKELSRLFYPIIPLLVFIPIISTIRGYLYSSVDTINHVGVSLIIEQVFRVLFIGLVLYIYMNMGLNLYSVALYSFFGFSIGILIALIFILLRFDYRLIDIQSINFNIGLKILKRSFFLLSSASLLLLFQLIDSLSIIKLLNLKLKLQDAMVIKGVYDRGLPIIQSAVFFVSPLLSSIFPHIRGKHDYGKLFSFILFLALPATCGLIFVLKDLNILLFQNDQYTYVLQISAITILLYALFLTLSAINQNHIHLFLILILGLVLKISGNIIFIKKWDIVGAAYSSVVSLFIMLIILLILNWKLLTIKSLLLLKIISGSFIMILILWTSSIIITNLFMQILVGITSYLLISLILKIKKTDFMIYYNY